MSGIYAWVMLDEGIQQALVAKRMKLGTNNVLKEKKKREARKGREVNKGSGAKVAPAMRVRNEYLPQCAGFPYLSSHSKERKCIRRRPARVRFIPCPNARRS